MPWKKELLSFLAIDQKETKQEQKNDQNGTNKIFFLGIACDITESITASIFYDFYLQILGISPEILILFLRCLQVFI